MICGYDKRDVRCGLDIIGDVHGCADELHLLLAKLGYGSDGTHRDGRKAVFVGDLCDNGPKNLDSITTVMGMCSSGNAFMVMGNHDEVLLEGLRSHVLEERWGGHATKRELELADPGTKERILSFLSSLPPYIVFDGGSLVVSHAGIKDDQIGRMSQDIRDFCINGEDTGEEDPYGLEIRADWSEDHKTGEIIAYGHVSVAEPHIRNGAYCLDTGCVHGNKLTALRYPEMEIVSQDALAEYLPSLRGLGNYGMMTRAELKAYREARASVQSC
jgi:protein phosphatase